MKNKTKGWVLLLTIMIVAAIAGWVFGHLMFGDSNWIYDHPLQIAVLGSVALGLIVFDIVVAWNYESKIAVVALIAATAATANAGLFTPAGGDSANSGKGGSYWSWLLRGWDFGWGFWRDGLDSWQSGHPVITIDPQPPASDDASSK